MFLFLLYHMLDSNLAVHVNHAWSTVTMVTGRRYLAWLYYYTVLFMIYWGIKMIKSCHIHINMCIYLIMIAKWPRIYILVFQIVQNKILSKIAQCIGKWQQPGGAPTATPPAWHSCFVIIRYL